MADTADARCTSASELLLLDRAVNQLLDCRQDLLRGRVDTCATPSVPDCAGSALAEVDELTYGLAPSTAVSARSQASRCQRTIGRASARYIRRRIRQRIEGKRRAPLRRFLANVGQRCRRAEVEILPDGRLPAVGDVCEATTHPTLDHSGLARCLSARLEAIIDDVSPAPITPNFVVVLTDDQRWDTLGVMPSLQEEVVRRGIQFNNGFATAAVCAPSRATLYSGLFAHNHGITTNALAATRFDASSSIAVPLARAGYETGLFGIYLAGASLLGTHIPDGWTHYFGFVSSDPTTGQRVPPLSYNDNGTIVVIPGGEYDRSTDRLRDEAVQFVRDNADRPFLALLAPHSPHSPSIPSRRHDGEFQNAPLHRPPNHREPDISLKPSWVHFAKAQAVAPPSADALREKQLEALQDVDDAVGDLSRLLDQLGLTDNTVFLFLSDHGQHWGEHWWGGKLTSYEESIRIPLILRYPRRYPLGRAEDALVLNADIAPTIADIADVSFPDGNGRSMLGTVDGTSLPRTDILVENAISFFVSASDAVRTPEWKYIRTDRNTGVTEELYDLSADPYELHNLAFEPGHQAQVDWLSTLLDVRKAEGPNSSEMSSSRPFVPRPRGPEFTAPPRPTRSPSWATRR